MLPDSIYIVSPERYQHSETFRELAEGLKEGFAELGYVLPITTVLNSEQPLVLGAHLLQPLPANAIIYNTEQVGSFWFDAAYAYVDLLRAHKVWDYSEQNIEKLKMLGIEAKYCGIGYEPCLTRIPQLSEEKQEIDVLFYGSVFGRREPILEKIKETGLNVKTLFGVYGVERDYYIARSKIILNLHAYEDSPFEIVRCSYLWANKKCVVSESNLYYYADGRITYNLSDFCTYFVTAIETRKTKALMDFQNFTKVRQSEYLKRVVEDARPPIS